MIPIVKKELQHYFSSLFGYLYYAMFFLLIGILFVVYCLSNYSTQFGYYVLSNACLVVILVVPFCTMRLFAQEKRDRTDQLIFTAPVSAFSILFGKYLATAVFVLLPIGISGLYPLWISMHGEMSLRFLAGAYLAVGLVTLVALSIGTFISSLTGNIVLAAILTYAVYGVILLGRVVEGLVNSDGFYHLLHDLSVYNKYYDMVSGIVRLEDIVYCLLTAVLFFLLTWIVLTGRRNTVKRTAFYAGFTLAAGILLGWGVLQVNRVYDFTAEQLLTLSEETKQTVSDITKTTDIYYLGMRSRANATYRELLNEYEKMSPNIAVHYINYRENPTFCSMYLSDISYINEASILVACGEQTIYLDSEDYISSIQLTRYSTQSLLEIENQLTSAIACVNTEDAKNIYTLTGHGEPVLNNKFRNMLLMNHYQFKEMELSERIKTLDTVFPDDCELVLLFAPATDYTKDEIDALSEYLKSGGKMMVVLDPLNEEPENLYAFLKEYGLSVVSGVVIEQEEARYAYDTAYYIIPKLQDTKFTEALTSGSNQVLFMTSKGIERDGEGNGFHSTDILTTSAKAFSKVENFEDVSAKSENDIAGPFSVASCAEGENGGSLFLITSDVFFNEEVDTDSGGANRRFLLNAVDILTGKEGSIYIQGKRVDTQTALYPNSAFSRIKIITIFCIPAGILLLGIFVVILRHRDIDFHKVETRKQDEEEQP
ncbi:MAG: Gldg family protein [Bacteroidales bacterium]|nr:Gldg family protein [Clostridium sp.]MCM1203120.1 Gldg family protein [Bacteroidales bacterium]